MIRLPLAALLTLFAISPIVAQGLTPTGIPLPSPLAGTEIVDCQPAPTDPITSPLFTTCTTRQIANLALTVGTTPIAGGSPGDCLYDNAGILGTKSCGGGVTSGAATSGCALSSLIWVNPSGPTILCNGGASLDNAGNLSASSFTGSVSGFAGQFVIASMAIFEGVTDGSLAATGTCAVAIGAGSSSVSGNFSPTGGCTAAQTVTLTIGATINHGFSCFVNNQTAAARSLVPLGAMNTSSFTFSVVGTLNASDLITYGCLSH